MSERDYNPELAELELSDAESALPEGPRAREALNRLLVRLRLESCDTVSARGIL